jgi:hypothetical protein
MDPKKRAFEYLEEKVRETGLPHVLYQDVMTHVDHDYHIRRVYNEGNLIPKPFEHYEGIGPKFKLLAHMSVDEDGELQKHFVKDEPVYRVEKRPHGKGFEEGDMALIQNGDNVFEEKVTRVSSLTVKTENYTFKLSDGNEWNNGTAYLVREVTGGPSSLEEIEVGDEVRLSNGDTARVTEISALVFKTENSGSYLKTSGVKWATGGEGVQIVFK